MLTVPLKPPRQDFHIRRRNCERNKAMFVFSCISCVTGWRRTLRAVKSSGKDATTTNNQMHLELQPGFCLNSSPLKPILCIYSAFQLPKAK